MIALDFLYALLAFFIWFLIAGFAALLIGMCIAYGEREVPVVVYDQEADDAF